MRRRGAGGRHIVSTRRTPPPASAGGLAGVIDSDTRPLNLDPVGIETATEQTVSDATGEALIIFGAPQAGTMWLLQSVLVHVTGSPGSSASVYVGPPGAANLRAGTNKGDLDTADQDPPVYVPSGQPVMVQWVAAGTGNTCTATIQYEVVAA